MFHLWAKESLMTVFYVLQNWKEYDIRKTGSGMDPRFFNCFENWEIEFLIKKIQHIYTFIPDNHIRKAISKACDGETLLKDRENFVSAVLEHLAIPVH
jgi:hypothetical protein